MNRLSNTQYQDIRQLAAARTPGHGLVSRFYGDPVVHEADLETIWFHGWLFVGHGCQLQTPGDYLTLQVDTEPVVVIRGDDGQLGAFSNICRRASGDVFIVLKGSADVAAVSGSVSRSAQVLP